MPVRTDASMPSVQVPTGGNPGRKTSGIRQDIQGLRAVAVGVVVLDHMVKWPSGGYVGVDIFFVISGFLITGLLLREYERSGTISFVDFYRRRLRRITPVAVLVLLVTVIAIFSTYGIGRAKTVLEDGAYSLFFAANWHFAATGTDYMQARVPASPLQHYWSLAVEEQFYLIWPVVIVVVLGLAANRLKSSKTRALRLLRVALIVITAASFAYACWQSRAEPTWAYFSTLSRGWELGVGALIATLTSRLSRIPAAARPVLASIGVVGIVASVILLDSHSVFPAPWGAVPVLATALVIAAGTGEYKPSRFDILSMKPMQYLGKISYSLYLWHFPVITIAATLFPQPQGPLTILAQVILMVLLSIASFHLIEDPVRKSNWLNDRRPSADRPAISRRWKSAWPKIVLVGVGPACLATLATIALSALPAAAPAQEDAAANIKELDIVPALRAQQIRSGLDAKTWPALTPSIDNLMAKAWVPEWREDSCQDVWEADLSRCMYGDKGAPKTAVLVGDSIAISYMPGLRAALVGSGWKIQSLTLQQCPAINISVLKDKGADGNSPGYPECDKHHEWVKTYLTRLHPDMIIMSSVQETVLRLASGAKGQDAINAWGQATGETLKEFAPLANKTVLIGPPPKGKVLPWCATTVNTPKDCVAERTAEQIETQSAEFAAASAAPSNVSTVDTMSWFCDSDNRCPSFVGNTPMFADGGHLTENYSKMLGPVLRDGLLGQRK
ncbi:acyltransferase family protein [Arthrobacter sp. FW306-04-A]|uniref:acyltransferase family protein n=1 Tax=Arthrobacter sp. FW306-04-A TaxID=2879619 RepID=UPI0037BFC79E|nr:acyltransferase [Arthrobacter sp. FW306-04-A]